jgi:putative hemolysin
MPARKARLRRLADPLLSKAKAAVHLAESPNRFLATVQVGITLVGTLAGAFGGATLAEELVGPLSRIHFLADYAEKIAFGIVVAAITYFSLVLGELVPKRFGLSNPEGIAMFMARPMNFLSRAASPLVTFLTASTEGLLRLLRFKPEPQTVVSEEEVRVLMQEGLRAGSFNKVETHIVHSALELDQLTVRDLMTPRAKIIWLNVDDPHDAVWHKIVVSAHSHFPVFEGNRDCVVGFVSVKSIYAHLAQNVPVKLRDLVTPPLIVPAVQTAVRLLETFKEHRRHIALVTDEFGTTVGLVTLHDIMEAVLGDLPTPDERSRPSAKKREDGSWLIDGMIPIEEVDRALPGFRLTAAASQDYQTLAGFVVKQLNHIPKEGETFEAQGYTFEVLDMDRHRVDKVLVSPIREQFQAKN